MRLICPNCGAQYEVPTEVIPNEGRDVQCSACSNTWFQAHPDHDSASADEIDTPSVEPVAPPPPEPVQPQRRELDPNISDVLREEAEFEAAENATAREAALEANRLENGMRQAEADGISAAERRELVAEIETNVREGWNEDDRAYTDDRFEQLVRERDLLEANGGSTQQRVALATEFTQLSLARQNDELSPEEARRADAILRDTADRYGNQMLDGLQRDDTREFMSIHDEGYFSRDERADEFEIERRREFRFAMQPYQSQQIDNPEIRRVVEHERSDDVSPSLATDEQRLSYREQIEQELDNEQIERLREGDSDALESLSDDRLDRLYAAKAYLQSDAATANSEAYREVVQEIADEQYELQKDRLVDSEREGGPVHG